MSATNPKLPSWIWHPAPQRSWETRQKLEARAKVAYDAYTTAAGELDATPFCQLWPRQLAGWVAVVEALETQSKEKGTT
jgi:hypothetical protein